MNLQDDRPHTIDVMGRRVRRSCTSFVEGSSASKLRLAQRGTCFLRAILKFVAAVKIKPGLDPTRGAITNLSWSRFFSEAATDGIFRWLARKRARIKVLATGSPKPQTGIWYGKGFLPFRSVRFVFTRSSVRWNLLQDNCESCNRLGKRSCDSIVQFHFYDFTSAV